MSINQYFLLILTQFPTQFLLCFRCYCLISYSLTFSAFSLPHSSSDLRVTPAGTGSIRPPFQSSPLHQFPQCSSSIPVFDFPLVCKDKKQTPAMGTFSEYPFQPPHLLSVLLSLFFLPRSSLSSGKVKRWVVYSVIFRMVDLNKDALQIPLYV